MLRGEHLEQGYTKPSGRPPFSKKKKKEDVSLFWTNLKPSLVDQDFRVSGFQLTFSSKILNLNGFQSGVQPHYSHDCTK